MVGSGYRGCKGSVKKGWSCVEVLRDTHRTSGNTLFHIEPSWRLNKLMEEAVAVEVGGLSQNLMAHAEMDKFLSCQA